MGGVLELMPGPELSPATQEEPLAASWEILRRNPDAERLPTTMTGLEAIERVSRGLYGLTRVLRKYTPITVSVLPCLDEDKVASWKVFLSDLPKGDTFKCLESLTWQNVSAYETLEDAIEQLFKGVLEILDSHLSLLDTEIDEIKSDLKAHRAEHLSVRNLRQAMGSYDREQLVLFK